MKFTFLSFGRLNMPDIGCRKEQSSGRAEKASHQLPQGDSEAEGAGNSVPCRGLGQSPNVPYPDC